MSKKALAAWTLGTGLLAFLAVLYVFYPSSTPQVSPGKPEVPREVPFRTAPEFAGKPAAPAPGAPPVQEPPAVPAAQDSPAPAEKPLAEVKPPAPSPEASPPPAPKEQYGFLVGRYRNHREAVKMKEKVEKQGKPAFIRHDGRQRQPYALWVGPFASKDEAKVAANAIEARLNIAAKTEKLQMTVPK